MSTLLLDSHTAPGGEPAARQNSPRQVDASATAARSILPEAAWRAREAAHQQRADALTLGRRERAGTGRTHPVDDFLFTYYPMRPGLLRRWHPGAGTLLENAADDERAGWKWYTSVGADSAVDAAAFVETSQRSIRFILGLLGSTAERPASFGCFGLHEWAMVYRQGEHRHEAPLRLEQDTTDSVVESHKIVCTHFDAFRFFTPEAVRLNRLDLTRENQPQLEQPGCLHAGMDVYKWVTKLGPLIPGELLLDAFDLARDIRQVVRGGPHVDLADVAFDLARDIRQVDMRASPSDLTAWGYQPIPIETAEGKAEYVRQQRGFTERGNTLRARVIATVAPLLPAVRPRPHSGGARLI